MSEYDDLRRDVSSVYNKVTLGQLQITPHVSEAARGGLGGTPGTLIPHPVSETRPFCPLRVVPGPM